MSIARNLHLAFGVMAINNETGSRYAKFCKEIDNKATCRYV